MKVRDAGWRAAYIVAAIAMLLVDQATKAWAVRRLRFGNDITVINNFLAFTYAENTGIAFGGFQGAGDWGRWILVGLAAAAAVGVFYYFWRTPLDNDRTLGACALLFAGIWGNLMDRVRLGYVVDFVLLHAGDYHWPVFNVADACICAGALLLALDIFFEGKKSARHAVALTQELPRGEEAAEGKAR